MINSILWFKRFDASPWGFGQEFEELLPNSREGVEATNPAGIFAQAPGLLKKWIFFSPLYKGEVKKKSTFFFHLFK